MPEPEPKPRPEPQPLVEYQRLNLLGKVVFVSGAAVRLAAGALDLAINKTVDLVVEAERVFKAGLDDGIDDANILDEHRD